MQLLTPKEVAARLSVSPRTVYSWIAEGRLDAVHLSERVTRVPAESVDALVEQALMRASRSVGQPQIAAEAHAVYEVPVGDVSTALMTRIQAVRTELQAAADLEKLCNVRVFGSVARGEATAQSDVDLLVDPQPGCTLFNLTGFRQAAEELLGVTVDVVPARSLNADAALRVLVEAIEL